jgi:prepilin-type N-terminal cleavage/methylation domain-containing protein
MPMNLRGFTTKRVREKKDSCLSFSNERREKTRYSGFTLIELMVAVGLFAIIMILAAGAYLIIIGINNRVQSMTAGINNLSFALETMTRDIRTGTGYSVSGSQFTFTNSQNQSTTYSLSSGALQKRIGTAAAYPITDSSAVQVTSLSFLPTGTVNTDTEQSRVIILISGSVSGKTPQSFTVETSATMRGSDL